LGVIKHPLGSDIIKHPSGSDIIKHPSGSMPKGFHPNQKTFIIGEGFFYLILSNKNFLICATKTSHKF
jgi:hypothetical protein